MWNDNSNNPNNSSSTMNASGYKDTSLNVSAEKSSGFKRDQGCTPLMVQHLLRHGEDIRVWGAPVGLINLVVILRSFQDLGVKVSFTFEDETGTIKGIQWLDGECRSFECPVRLNCYAKVYGKIRQQNNETYVLVTNIQPLKHIYELTSHLMEVTRMCLQCEKESSQVKSNDNTIANHSADVSNSPLEIAIDHEAGLTKDQSIVLGIIKQYGTSENGAERNFIKSKTSPFIRNQVDKILEFLSGEGHVYTTTTDDYFKHV